MAVMLDPIYSIVFSTAFLGSGHCLGMCGPVVAALSMARGRGQGVLFHLLYHAGRLTTYTGIGITAGWVGSILTTGGAFTTVSHGLLLLADLLVIGMGLSTSGLLAHPARGRFEFPGAVGVITGSVSRLRELPGVLAALPLGLLMGFLPCGFLYAIALGAAGRGEPVQGGMIMLAFGLGTLPVLLFFGGAVHWLTRQVRAQMLRWAGVLVVFVGCLNFAKHMQLATGM